MIDDVAQPGSLTGRLFGRVAIVAGSASAIGCGIARRFASEGATVVLIDADPAAAERTSHAIGQFGGSVCIIAEAPPSREAADRTIADILARCGRVDILVAAADYRTTWERLLDKTEAAFDEAFRSFREAAVLLQATLPAMRAGGGGSIIALGSTYGQSTQPYIADYLAAKAALKSLVFSAAQEWGPFNIRANLLTAAADTEEFRKYRERRGASEIDAGLEQLPMPYRGDVVRDIGGAALFLASDDSRYLTGEVIHADGGEHLATPLFEPGLDRAEQI
ncbi:3-oxoacyl-[acyl-carrier protein] reductase [Sphingobium xenophagum]|uniref:3-oxoacyl-[acyl-carrier protein] reductase n=1 Tax=Sphingobium xenophagum TaxID=121428 RepID=A0ABU1X816_SPHXE|nr:SDR family oxidoreductase [Sphingobium xenophagum]MDR7157267.1 3-oxoacyl-[acyl-carrier protein] reductase [Sphingobium xenophagum]